MTTKAVKSPTITQITSSIVDMLSPLNSEDRGRVVQATLTLLGEAPIPSPDRNAKSGSDVAGDCGHGVISSSKARAWVRQNGISEAELEQVFDISGDGTVGVIGFAIPGKSVKDKVLNAYIVQGISRLLATGDTAFDDKSARSLCEELGCYDPANHALYMKGKGTVLTGSKDKGWKLTAPGLKRGAELIKEIAKGS